MSRSDARIAVKLPKGSMFWTMHFDLTDRAMYVYMGEGEVLGTIASEDLDFTVDIGMDKDGTPIILGLEMLDPNRLSIIQDFIDDGIEKVMETLNVRSTDDFADNHWRAIQIAEEEDGD